MNLQLRNPHSVLAALARRPQDVLEVSVLGSRLSPAWDDVLAQAEDARIPIVRRAESRQHKQRRKNKANEQGGRTGAAEATVKPSPEVELEAFWRPAGEDDTATGLWLALDCLQDPHNVGAIFRTAAFFGVKGIVLSKDRSAPLNGTVYDVSSGGMESVPYCVQPNLTRALQQAKKNDMWVLGTSEHAERDIAEVSLDRRWLLVLGNEEKGLRRLTLETCDDICRLTPRGEVTSLNVSVAAGILIAGLTLGNLQSG